MLKRSKNDFKTISLIFLFSIVSIVVICTVNFVVKRDECSEIIINRDKVINDGLLKNRDRLLKGLRQLDWWENAVVYQVYLRSFKNSAGDGIGDINGLTSKLEHFVDAGIRVVWLSPIFTSPMVDFGYDVSDFYNIHYEYGIKKDFENMLDKAHKFGIRVLLDYVLNQASTESVYFKLSEARHPGYENYFIWAAPRPDPNNSTKRLAPSNWLSEFGGSIWEWSEKRQQYYLHQFAKSQGDFNLRESAVREELVKIFKFWLEKGVDGSRLDALPHVFEASPVNGLYPDEPLTGNTLVTPFEIGLLLGEAYTTINKTMLYYGDGHNRNGVHFPFNFDFIDRLTREFTANDFVYVIMHWFAYLPYGKTANWVVYINLRKYGENAEPHPVYASLKKRHL